MIREENFYYQYEKNGGDMILPKEVFWELYNDAKELERRCEEPRFICGIPINEVIRLLNGLTTERKYQMNLTMDMLSEWQKILEEEMYESMRKSIDRQINELFGENNE